MKMFIMMAALLVALTPGAFAQGHGHADKGPNGGKMEDVAGVHAELIVSDKTVTVHIYDEAGKPVPTAGFTSSMLVGAGQTRQVVQLAPSAGNTMVGTAANPIARGTQMTLQLKTSGGKSGQAKY